MAGLPDDLVESVSVLHPQAAAPADNSTQDGIDCYRLTEHPQHCLSDKGPQLSQKIETALALLIHRMPGNILIS